MAKTVDVSELGMMAVNEAMVGALRYIEAKQLRADPIALHECVKSWVKIKLPEAMNDAREAIEANMPAAAAQTFLASMRLAGIEAAKEAGFPEKKP